MNEFDARECDVGSGCRLETEHGIYPAFDAVMILLNGVIHVFARADRDGITRVFQPVFRIALQDGNAVGLATIDSDPFWSAVASQCLG